MICPVERDLYRHLDQKDIDDQDAEFIEQRQCELLTRMSEMTFEEMDYFLENEYYINLIDWIEDNAGHDGVIEYFIQGDNQHYRNAANQLISDIDLSDELEKHKRDLEGLA